MGEIKNHKSVSNAYTRNAMLLIVLSAIFIGGMISYLSYSDFIKSSEQLETEHIASQKAFLQREVSYVEDLIKYRRSKLDNLIKTNIKSRVYEAHTIATNIYNKFKDTRPKHEIVSMIKEALRPLRFFDGRGYFFMFAMSGNGVLHPPTPHLENTDLNDLQNIDGMYLTKEAIKLVKKQKEGFMEYTWSKPGTQKQFKKVSFFKNFAPYNWVIGTGDYIADVERNIQKEILERIGEIRFGKEGYIFVVNYDGTVMMNRGQQSLIGKNIIDVRDAKGVKVAHEVIQLAQTPGWDGFFEYHWQKLTSSTVSPKIAYHKTVPDWGWYYGTGVYLDDVQEVINQQRGALKDKLVYQLFLIASTVFIAIALLLYLARIRTKALNNDLRQLIDFFKLIPEKPEPINTEKLKFSEFKQLATSANIMLDGQNKADEQRTQYEQQLQQSQKIDAITQMVGGVAHDFNNLLGVILGYGELLELKLSDKPELENYSHQINAAGKRGAKLTRKLLSLTHKTSTESQISDINTLLREEEEFLKKSLTAKIKLEMILEADLWPVTIDRSEFEDVILNLCVNAMHAMYESQQDSRIRIETNNVQLDSSDSKQINLTLGDYVQLTVEDNGIGMDEETQMRVFDPFFTTREEGSGLGLSQAYSFVRRSKGSIRVDSTPGVGTRFELLFPRSQTTQDELTTETQTAAIDTVGTETILVVDDEKPLRDLNTYILSNAGYRVLTASNGIEALTILEEESVDLVLSDIIMPNMDGNLLAERIKQLYPGLKIQFISGHMKKEDFTETNADLYQNILNKPVAAATLLKRVRSLLDQENPSA